MWPALKNPASRKLWFATVSFSPRVAEHDNASQFRHKGSLWLLFNTWTRCTVKLLDSSPACDAGCLHTVHLGAGRTKASDFEFGFVVLRTLCWNLLYACVWHLGASEGGLDR